MMRGYCFDKSAVVCVRYLLSGQGFHIMYQLYC